MYFYIYRVEADGYYGERIWGIYASTGKEARKMLQMHWHKQCTFVLLEKVKIAQKKAPRAFELGGHWE